jgi:hypothetical protein
VSSSERSAYAAAIPAVYARSPTVLSERFGDVTVVLDHRTGRSARLNAAAGCVWDALETPATAAAVAQRLAARFGLTVERANVDAAAALAGLEVRGFVTCPTAEPAP